MTVHCIGILFWPQTSALSLAIIESTILTAQGLHPENIYDLVFIHAEQLTNYNDSYRSAFAWEGTLEQCDRIFLVADEPPQQISAPLAAALKQRAREGDVLGAISAGVYPLAQLGLLNGHRAAVHWRWLHDFKERFPKVIATDHLFEWDRDRISACRGLAAVDLMLTMLSRDHGSELASAVCEELMVERIRDGNDHQRMPLKNRLGSSPPKLTHAVLLMEANIGEPLTTDEIARYACMSRRQLERIFKQYLDRAPSQYYLELRLKRARHLLLQSSTSIIQVGLSCGFSSGAHFSRAYSQYFGRPPRDERILRRGLDPMPSAPGPSERD